MVWNTDFLQTPLNLNGKKLNNFNNISIHMDLFEELLKTKYSYVVAYILINVGFIISVITKISSNIYIDISLYFFIIILLGLMILNVIVSIPEITHSNFKIPAISNLKNNKIFILQTIS